MDREKNNRKCIYYIYIFLYKLIFQVDQYIYIYIYIWPKKIAFNGANKQTERQTDGHRDSKTELAQWPNSVRSDS